MWKRLWLPPEAARAIWNNTQAPQRAAILLRFSQLLLDSKDELARIITLEQGKALCESMGEVTRAAAEAAFAAGEAVRLSGTNLPQRTSRVHLLHRSATSRHSGRDNSVELPCSESGAEDSPGAGLWQHGHLETGFIDSVVCHISSLVSSRTLAYHPGVLNLVIGSGECGEKLISDARVRGISFTGSTAVGIRIAEKVAGRMAKIQLELGGKNPAIVLQCDDLDTAAQEIVGAAFLCSGQRCTALSRVIVEESQADQLRDRLTTHIAKIRVGNGLDPQTTMGPVVSQEQMEDGRRLRPQGFGRSMPPWLLAGAR